MCRCKLHVFITTISLGLMYKPIDSVQGRQPIVLRPNKLPMTILAMYADGTNVCAHAV